MPGNLENSAVATGLEKVSFHSNPKQKAMPKNAQTTAQLYSSHASKIMLKIFQARLQQYMNCELPDVQGGLEKAKELEIKLPTSTGSSKKQEFWKGIYFCFIDNAKAFDCVGYNKLWKILKEM